jgi:ribosomal protein S18 acetylase RimI-like enzyme|tara:strand:- start:612 stop:1052 length:441 start_codon:yes stop_codon:yes gene_type:complete
MAISYTNNLGNIKSNQLQHFFVDWSRHPDSKSHLDILHGSYAVWLAFDDERCVGFVNALSDGIFYAYIPLLEVLPEYQGQGIGKELVERMQETLEHMYAIDIVCDESVSLFYDKLGFSRCVGMVKRNYANQEPANKVLNPTPKGAG